MAKQIENPVKFEYDWSNFNMEAYDKASNEYIEKCRQLCKDQKLGNSDLVGHVSQFPVADGYARYMIVCVKPMVVIHLPLDDGYEAHAALIRGLNEQDIRDEIEWNMKVWGKEQLY